MIEILYCKEKKHMADKNKNPRYAPGIDDTDIIPPATDEDLRRDNVTVETRLSLDENDPSGEDKRSRD